MSSVPPSAPQGSAQMAAQAQARAVADAVRAHRRAISSMANSRGGMCLADGWDVSIEALDGDFDIDAAALDRLFAAAGQGPSASPAPGAGAAAAAPSAIKQYLFPPAATGAPGSARRLGEEAGSAVWGAGNIAANSAAALAGALQGVNEAGSASRLVEGIRDILAGRARVVKIAPSIELYNAAQGRQRPRVRLRIRGLPIKVVTQAIPATGGPVTQWRVNGAGTAATLKAGSMTAQQMRNAAVLAGERQLPGALRWAASKTGGGVLTFVPSLMLDAYDSIESDLQTGGSRFNGQKFLIAQARSQSGNVVGFAGGLMVAGAAGVFVAGAPLVVIGLIGGIAFQLLWNWQGGADAASEAAAQALR